MLDLSSSCIVCLSRSNDASSSSTSCVTCEKFKEEVKNLKDDISRLTCAREKLDEILKSQIPSHVTHGLGYDKSLMHHSYASHAHIANAKKIPHVKKVHKHLSKCTYCERHGHTSYYCKFRRNPNGLKQIWVVKKSQPSSFIYKGLVPNPFVKETKVAWISKGKLPLNP